MEKEQASTGHRRLRARPIEPHTSVHHRVRGLLESIQDFIVLVLCFALFLVMARALVDLVRGAVDTHQDVRALLSQVLFVMVLLEFYRLLIIYLREHRVAVNTVVEIALVSALREVVLKGVTDLNWIRLLAITAFLLALGALLRWSVMYEPEATNPGREWKWQFPWAP